MPGAKYNTGIVLSGGGARGFAHLGVLQALNEAGFYPDVVAGTSAGAIAGTLYCDGYHPVEILNMFTAGSRLNFVRPVLPRDGLLQISGITKILESHLRAKTFEELKIPLIVTATNLNEGRVVYFSSGELITPLIASSSIPVLFKPVIINNACHVDGGILDNLPIQAIENTCKIKIGSHVNPVGFEDPVSGLIAIAVRTFMLAMSKESIEKSDRFDLFIAPLELKNHGMLDPEKAGEIYSIGYKATKEKLDDNKFHEFISSKLSG
jgi:NTE family protein